MGEGDWESEEGGFTEGEGARKPDRAPEKEGARKTQSGKTVSKPLQRELHVPGPGPVTALQHQNVAAQWAGSDSMGGLCGVKNSTTKK